MSTKHKTTEPLDHGNSIKFDPLTLGVMFTSPEFGAWAFHGAPNSGVFRPEAVARVIDAHASVTLDAVHELQRARDAAGLAKWNEARRAIRKAFALMSDPVRHRDGLLNFVDNGAQTAKSASKASRKNGKGRA
jgi:hypothetical protein